VAGASGARNLNRMDSIHFTCILWFESAACLEWFLMSTACELSSFRKGLTPGGWNAVSVVGFPKFRIGHMGSNISTLTRARHVGFRKYRQSVLGKSLHPGAACGLSRKFSKGPKLLELERAWARHVNFRNFGRADSMTPHASTARGLSKISKVKLGWHWRGIGLSKFQIGHETHAYISHDTACGFHGERLGIPRAFPPAGMCTVPTPLSSH
jgi:hypothetical protein